MLHTKIPLHIGLDYVDLSGQYRSITLFADSKQDAIACLNEAWNSNLLWHFDVSVDNITLDIKTRKIPWPADNLASVLALIRMSSDIEKYERELSAHQAEILNSYKTAQQRDYQRISRAGESRSKINALKDVYLKLSTSLMAQGIQPPRSNEKGTIRIIECVWRAAKTLENLAKIKKDDRAFGLLGGLNKKAGKNFIDSLPVVEGIFMTGEVRLPA